MAHLLPSTSEPLTVGPVASDWVLLVGPTVGGGSTNTSWFTTDWLVL